MKKVILIFALIISFMAKAQILNPVKWKTAVTKISDSEYELVATATIESGWHLYSQNVPENGPIPTSFTFEGNSNYLKKGNTAEEKGNTLYHPIFEMQITYFANKADFKQRIKLKGKKPFQVKSIVEFMVCDDSKCLPPSEVDLVFSIN